MIYKEGIFSENGLIDMHAKANQKNTDRINAEFELNSFAQCKSSSKDDDDDHTEIDSGDYDQAKVQIKQATTVESKEDVSEASTLKEELTKMKKSKSTKKSKEDSSQYSDKSLNDKGIAWEDMNHSVVIVGWGKDEKSDSRYWIVRNSYGQKWGMNGDFLVKKGDNDFGMEVEQIAFEPEWA